MASLRGFYFGHYKAFREMQDPLELRPLTILLGPNNVGKTSLLNLLLLMVQTATTNPGYRAPLRLDGRYVQMGDPANLFSDGETDKPLLLGFQFQSDYLSTLLGSTLREEYFDNAESLVRMLYDVSRSIKSEREQGLRRRLMDIYSRLRLERGGGKRANFAAWLDQVAAVRRDILAVERPARKAAADGVDRNRGLHGRRNTFAGHLVRDFVKSDFAAAQEFLKSAQRQWSGLFDLCFEIAGSKEPGGLRTRTITLRGDGMCIVSIHFGDATDAESLTVQSDLVAPGPLRRSERTLARVFHADRSLFDFANPRGETLARYIPALLVAVLGAASSALAAAFNESRVSHVGPQRAFPRRFYLLDPASSMGPGGDNMIDLLSEDRALLSGLNAWLGHFGVTIGVSKVMAGIHRVAVRQEGVTADLDITEVGFGVSQVLPVVARTLLASALPDSIMLIEQPEIHLHPDMQAQLADFLIEKSCNPDNGRVMIVETHSESFLNRLRRRIAQGDIPAEKVAVYVVERKASSSQLRRIPVPNGGGFEWPRGFYETSLGDTMHFYQQQAKHTEAERKGDG
jgi:hypothetical protein